MTIFKPVWADIQRLASSARSELFICSPYITEEGIGKVFDSLAGGVRVALRTRLSLTDWAKGVSDPEALSVFLELLGEGGHETDLLILQRLHAKLYAADGKMAFLGSANLTGGGFGGNIELAVWLQGDGVQTAVNLITAHDSRGTTLATSDLIAWISRSRSAVDQARRQAQADDAEVLASAQSDLDGLLGFGRGRSEGLPDVGRGDLEAFASWLELNVQLPGAQVILNRYTNIDGQNLTGHVKQCFSAATRFFAEHPELVDPVSASLAELRPGELYSFTDQSVFSSWINHLDAHALDHSEYFSYPVLRGILPPALGGGRTGGGGGSSTLKRLLPLVARYRRS